MCKYANEKANMKVVSETGTGAYLENDKAIIAFNLHIFLFANFHIYSFPASTITISPFTSFF